MAEITADTDHAARIVAFLDDWRNGDVVWFANGEDVAPLTISDLRAAMDELKQLREYVAALNEAQVGLQTSAFKRGWWACRDAPLDADCELDALSYANQVRALSAEPTAFAGACDCECQPGHRCFCPERDCYCGPCPVCDRDENAPESKPPTRQGALLAVIQREGGDWSPLRARTALMNAGYDVASNLAAQEMKTLAEHGYLEPVRPRAYTYRLKAVAQEQPEPGADADGVG